jgi:hypothetical protein
VERAFSGGLHPTSGICGSAGEPVKQSVQPFLLPSQESGRCVRLKNPTAPVSLGEQRIGTVRAQDPLKMRNCSVKVLWRVGAHPGACVGRDFHNGFSQFYSFSDEWHAAQKVPPGPLPTRQLVRCLVCLSKRNGKDTGNTMPE